MTIIHYSRNNINNEIKIKIANSLNQLLSDYINLGLITKHAHWNIKGSNFISMHKMLDSFRETIDEHQDIIAERIAQIGSVAFGTINQISNNTEIDSYPEDIQSISQTLPLLADRYAFVANKTRELITIIEDEDTADILTAASRDLDKLLWFIESHIE